MNKAALIVLACLTSYAWHLLASYATATEDVPPVAARPVASTGSGLLLQPPLDLSWFSRRDFEAESSTVGIAKIGKKWTSAITPLPAPPGQEGRTLTEDEVKATMLRMRDLFDGGKSVPVSDVGLISTQEDIVRKPMYNHVAAFTNPGVNGYLLVQKTAGNDPWGYFAIVQDRKAEPPLDYFGEITKDRVKFEGTYCYKCHASGPLAIHPAREDLVSDLPLLLAINRHIADQPQSRMHLPDNEQPGDHGAPLALKACTKCHAPDATRGPLFRTQSHSIRVLVDFGHMPPGRRLNPEELAGLKAWLDEKR